FQHVEKDALVIVGMARLEGLLVAEVHADRVELVGRKRIFDMEPQGNTLIRLDHEKEHVRIEDVARPAEEPEGEALELYAYLRHAPRQPLARPEVEGHARPPQVVYEEPPGEKRGCRRGGGDVRLP